MLADRAQLSALEGERGERCHFSVSLNGSLSLETSDVRVRGLGASHLGSGCLHGITGKKVLGKYKENDDDITTIYYPLILPSLLYPMIISIKFTPNVLPLKVSDPLFLWLGVFPY